MICRRKIIGKLLNQALGVRSYAASVKKNLLIQKTTYPTDDWTNINERLEPFLGANLFRKQNHPLRFTQEEVVSFFKKWFKKHVDDNFELPVYKNIGPVEPNVSSEKLPEAFYVNKNFVLRTHAKKEIQYLQSGEKNFVMILELYRRCQMDVTHFPIFHRLNVIRSIDCEQVPIYGKQNEAQEVETRQHLKEEQQAALVEMAKHLLGTDVNYRWTESNSVMSTEPSWNFEIFHQDEWHRISGGGLIRNAIFEQSEQPNSAGWEIAIGLDRLAMMLYNIFDIRLLWNSDQKFLNQFQPKKISEKLRSKLEQSPEKNTLENVLQRPTMKTEQSVINKKRTKCEMHISYILPQCVDLESFCTDDLCKFILQNTENAANTVDIYDTFYNSKLDTYVINVKVEYKIGQKKTKREIKNLHESVRAHAAHNFNLTLRL